MAGMLPGVELARRRRAGHDKHRLGVDSPLPRPHSRIQAPSNMDETALRARRNLEQKLRGLSSSPRSKLKEDRSEKYSRLDAIVESGKPNSDIAVRERGCGSKSERMKLEKEVGGVCLEVFQAPQGAMNLLCVHRCHDDRVSPWLTTHSPSPNCFW